MVLALLAAGCAIQEQDYDGLECQRGLCPNGYACDFSVGVQGICRVGVSGMDGGLDAGGFDAGPPIFRDAGEDAGVDAGGGNGCDNPAHIFCDDFESGTLSRWSQRVVGGSSVDITELAAHSGDFGVRATSMLGGVGGEPGMIFSDAFAGMSVSDQWVRAWFLFQRGTGQETTIMTLSDVGFDTVFFVDVLSLDEGGFYAPYGMMGDSDTFALSLTEDTWFCVEVHIEQGVTDGAFQVFVNGTEVASRIGVNTASRGVFPHVAFGSWHFAPSGARLVFVDDIVLSTEPVGCD